MKIEQAPLSQAEKENLMQINLLLRECRHLLVESAHDPNAIAFLTDVRNTLRDRQDVPPNPEHN